MENILATIEELLNDASPEVPVQNFVKTFVEEIQYRQKKIKYLSQVIERKYEKKSERTG
jgi:hypothetical protein